MIFWNGTANPLTLDVMCDGLIHQLEWSDGAVRMCQHPDADAELALIGLGAPEPRCLNLLRLWDEALTDGGFLEEWVIETHLSDAYRSWLGMALERMRLEGFQEFLRGLPINRAARMGQFVHSYPMPWLDRAAAEVAHGLDIGRGVSCTDAPRHLQDGTSVRVRRAFVNAVGTTQLSLVAAALVRLDVHADAHLEASITGSLVSTDRPVRIDVSPSWLHTTWARGAAVVDGHLILGLSIPSGTTRTKRVSATAEAVMWDGGVAQLQRRTAIFERNRWSLERGI